MEQENNEYQGIVSELVKLEKETDEFVFLVPKELKEIIQGSSALSHCVGNSSYLEYQKMARQILSLSVKKIS